MEDYEGLHPAEVAKIEAETELARERTRQARVERIQHELYLHQERAEEDAHHIYTFYGAVKGESVKKCMEKLGEFHRREPDKPIEVIFNSPGGSVFDGLALFDFIRNLPTRVDTIAYGYAASMGGILLQAGERRVMGHNCWMLIHEISDFAVGKTSELEDELELSKRLQDSLLAILAERSKLSKKKIAEKWKRKDWWLSAQEARKLGLVDEVR